MKHPERVLGLRTTLEPRMAFVRNMMVGMSFIHFASSPLALAFTLLGALCMFWAQSSRFNRIDTVTVFQLFGGASGGQAAFYHRGLDSLSWFILACALLGIAFAVRSVRDRRQIKRPPS